MTESESPLVQQFNAECCPTTCAGETVLLHPGKALFVPRTRALLVADVHLGKEYAFSRAGHAIPSGPSDADIQLLGKLVDASGAVHLHILGDLIHTTPDHREPWLHSLSRFLDHRPDLSVNVVAGNHDKHDAWALIDSRINWHPKTLLHGPFVLQHEPGNDNRGHVLCGHIHPCYRLQTGRNDSIRAPVFWLGKNHSVLPSFGQFTGGHNVHPESDDLLFMVGPDCVVPLPAKNARLNSTVVSATDAIVSGIADYP